MHRRDILMLVARIDRPDRPLRPPALVRTCISDDDVLEEVGVGHFVFAHAAGLCFELA